MARGKHIDNILRKWAYDPTTVSARMCVGSDGRDVLQMRVDMGLLQMEVDGRPEEATPVMEDVIWLDNFLLYMRLVQIERCLADIFDLEKTAVLLEEAKAKLAKIGEQGKTVLLVGTKDEAAKLVKQTAEEMEMPYVSNRWIGGTLTNFSEIAR